MSKFAPKAYPAFIVHNVETGEAKEMSREDIEKELGPTLVAQLVETGSLSRGKTVFEYRAIET